MKGLTWWGAVALIVSLILVGAIRSAIPEQLPNEYAVPAGEDNTVRTDEMDLQLVSIDAASAITSAREGSDARFEASPGTVIVLARLAVTPHGGPFTPRAQIRSADGFTYDSLPLDGFASLFSVDVGTMATATFIFEVPEEKLGGVIGVHGARADGLQPVWPVATFTLPRDLALDPMPAEVPDNVVEPVR